MATLRGGSGSKISEKVHAVFSEGDAYKVDDHPDFDRSNVRIVFYGIDYGTCDAGKLATHLENVASKL